MIVSGKEVKGFDLVKYLARSDEVKREKAAIEERYERNGLKVAAEPRHDGSWLIVPIKQELKI